MAGISVMASGFRYPGFGVSPNVRWLHSVVPVLAVRYRPSRRQVPHERHFSEIASRILDEPYEVRIQRFGFSYDFEGLEH